MADARRFRNARSSLRQTIETYCRYAQSPAEPNYPSKPIRYIVAFPAGGTTDWLFKRVDDCEDTVIDEYAAENPAQFFAMISEAFFATLLAVRGEYPEVYEQLALFYRQDPAARMVL